MFLKNWFPILILWDVSHSSSHPIFCQETSLLPFDIFMFTAFLWFSKRWDLLEEYIGQAILELNTSVYTLKIFIVVFVECASIIRIGNYLFIDMAQKRLDNLWELSEEIQTDCPGQRQEECELILGKRDDQSINSWSVVVEREKMSGKWAASVRRHWREKGESVKD